MTTPLPAGAVARARLAVRAAAALHWLAAARSSAGAAEITAADDALLALRTDLRSLRPVLDRDWTVSLRAGLDRTATVLQAVRRHDDHLRLLRECGATDAEPAVTRLRRDREQQVRTLRMALGPATRTRLGLLASGGSPAPLRTPGPDGDAYLPAAFVLPAMLRRRWRKLARDTRPEDLADVVRRAAELEIANELADECGLRVPALVAAARDVGAAAVAARRAQDAAELRHRLADGPVRDTLAAIASSREACADGVADTVSALGKLGRLVVTDPRTPARTAAGGLVVRTGPDGPAVLLVHRVRQDDWSVPKGATLRGESLAACALREVREETGLRCRLVEELLELTYRDRNGRPKSVRYWLMKPLVPSRDAINPAEIDGVRWVPLAAAAELVGRRRDRAVLDVFARRASATDRLVA